jgi:transposase
MILLTKDITVYLASDTIDMRKSIDGLSMLIVEYLNMKPHSPSAFVFHNRQRDKVKVLYWEKNGFVMHYKRLEKGKFKFDKMTGNLAHVISQDQLNWLLAGLDFNLMSQYPELDFTNYF